MNNTKKKDCNYIFAGLLSFVCINLILYFAKVIPGGEYSFLTTDDLYAQTVSFSKLYISKLFGEGSLLYSFNVGLGGNTSLLYAFYSLNPLNIIYLFIDELYLATYVIITCKVVLCSILFQLFCRYNLRISNYYTILAATFYSLNSFFFLIFTLHSLYDAVYYLPAILILVKYFINQKNPIPLTIGYIFLFFSNIYCTFIVGICSFAYVVYQIIKNKTKEKNYYVNILIGYFVSVIIAISISMFILLPAAYVVLNSNKIDDTVEYVAPNILGIIASMAPVRKRAFYNSTPYLYTGIMPLLLALCVFLKKDVGYKTKIAIISFIILFTVSFYIEPVYMLLHMFNFPDGYMSRYSFIFCFFIAALSVLVFKEENIKIKNIVIISSILYVFILLAKIFNIIEIEINNLIVTLVVMLFIPIAIAFYNSEIIKCILVCMTIFEIVFNGSYMLDIYTNGVTQEHYYMAENSTNNLLYSIKEYAPDDIYRIDFNNIFNTNLSCEKNYYGINLFSSANSSNILNVLSKMGYIPAKFMFREFGANDYSRMLLGERFVATIACKENEQENIRELPYYLGLGYMVNENIKDIDLNDFEGIENLDKIVKAMTGMDEFANYNSNGRLELDGVDLQYGESAMLFSYSYASEDILQYGKAKILLDKIDGMDAYIYVTPLKFTQLEYMEPILFSSFDDNFYYEYKSPLMIPHIVKMYENNDGNMEADILIGEDEKREVFISKINLAYIKQSKAEEIYDHLKDNQLNITQMKDGYISGNIDVPADKTVLFMSIPYEKGWNAYVDGEYKEITPVIDDGFIGINLEPGVHNVELIFEAPLSKIGKLISLVGVMAFLCEIIYYAFVRKKKE